MPPAPATDRVLPRERDGADDGFLDIECCRDVLEPFQARWRELAAEAERLGAEWAEHPDSYYAPFGWYLWPVRYFGIDNPDAMETAPLLASLVAREGRVMTAQYLRLAPGAEVAPHQGRPMGVARFHLGLSIPDDCALQVGDVTRGWTEGEWLAFDDVRTHRTWNRSDRDRIVLSLDMEHPSIRMTRTAYFHRFAQGAFYDFVRRSPRTYRSLRWFNRAVRSRFWPPSDFP